LRASVRDAGATSADQTDARTSDTGFRTGPMKVPDPM
jgi:hypothetical protein